MPHHRKRSSSHSEKKERKHRKRSSSSKSECKRHSSKSRSHSHSSRSRSRSCSPEPFCEIYKKYKQALLCDPTLMLSGSDAYGSIYNRDTQNVKIAGAVTFEYDQTLYNVEHRTPNGHSIFVRKDGTYLIEFVAFSQDPCQFTFFLNNVHLQQTCIGRNSGGGKTINHQVLFLKKDDEVTIRNYRSAGGNIILGDSGGGTNIGTNAEVVLHKIAPYPDICHKNCCDKKKDDCYEKKLCKLSKKKKCLFNKILCALENDPELQLNGSPAYGSFYRTTSVAIAINNPVIFEAQTNVRGLVLQPNNSDVLVSKDGIYNMIFLVECDKSAQFTVFVNGVPDLTTTSGLNKGANQLYLRQTLILHQGDLVSVQNYISSAGTVNLIGDAGGALPGTNCVLILERISPLMKPAVCCKESCELPKCVKLFKEYMMMNHALMPEGSDAYFNITRNTVKTFNVGDTVSFATNLAIKNVYHQQGSDQVHIHKDGVYELYFDSCTDKSAQFTICVNGVPDPTTTNGTNSAEGQSSNRQLVALHAGDVLTVVNWQSFLANISTVENAGGDEVATSMTFCGVKIAPLCVPPPCHSRPHSPKP